jgi:hypothetical protein
MKLSTLKLVALAVVCAPFAVACSADTSDAIEGDGDDVSVDEANAARIAPGEFKLYMEPRATPNPNCDPHTKLVLSATGGSKAHLEEALGGFCELAVVPNPRDYRLRAAGQDCGSRIFTGSFKKNGEKHSIKIIDNRTRLCENVVAGAIEVEETTPRGTVMKYSYDAPPEGETVTVEGDLVATMGIGGENTGVSIKTANETIELVLDDGERNQFSDGKHAKVTGKRTTLSGVETRNRPALDVESMLVCPNPGYVNCMPGPNRRLSNLCSSENRTWAEASCPGVSFTF